MNDYNLDVLVVVPQTEDEGSQSLQMNSNCKRHEEGACPPISYHAGNSLSLENSMQRCESAVCPPMTSSFGDSLPRKQRIQFIDYTRNRNPRYETDTSFGSLHGSPNATFTSTDNDRCDRSPLLSDRKSTYIFGRQSIDTGAFLNEMRPNSSEERIDFMFKVQAKQARKSSREDLLAALQPRSSIPRQREHLSRMFNTIPNKSSRAKVAKRNHSAPDCLRPHPDP